MALSPDMLRDMLAQDTANIDQLKQLLETERKHLQARDHQALASLTETKNQLLEQLGAHSRQRQQWLQEAGLPCDQSGWQTLLEREEQTRELAEPWQTLTERLSECQELNDINGKIIGRSRQTLGHLLSVLRGQVDEPQLYTAEGEKTPENGSQSIVKA